MFINNSVIKTDKKYYPQTFLEECVYKQQKQKQQKQNQQKNYITEELKSGSDTNNESESELESDSESNSDSNNETKFDNDE